MEEIVQGSPEWHQIRLGKVTASRVADVIARTKTGWGAGRANYAAELIAERLTGTVADSFTSAAMQWGTDNEPSARAAYQFEKNTRVGLIGFVNHPTIYDSGASPDGLVGDEGLVEIKCPNTATHIETLIKKSIPSKYITQMLWQMACTGRHWCDFVSYDPRLPDNMQVFIQRVPRDDVAIRELENEVTAFLLEEVDAKVGELLRLYGQVAA